MIIGICIGIVIMSLFFILVFMLLPTRKITKSSDRHWDNLEMYWLENNITKKRQATALENIAEHLQRKGK